MHVKIINSQIVNQACIAVAGRGGVGLHTLQPPPPPWSKVSNMVYHLGHCFAYHKFEWNKNTSECLKRYKFQWHSLIFHRGACRRFFLETACSETIKLSCKYCTIPYQFIWHQDYSYQSQRCCMNWYCMRYCLLYICVKIITYFWKIEKIINMTSKYIKQSLKRKIW